MIDPEKITDYHRTTHQLEEFLLFCIVAAGKNASVQALKLEALLTLCPHSESPFERLTMMHKKSTLLKALELVKMGQYARIHSAILQLLILKPDLKTCITTDLETVSGIGPKTSRFFILHSRPNQRLAVLDTHVLKYMREKKVKVPKSTPSGKLYLRLEQEFLKLVPANKSIADFDLEIWMYYARNKKDVVES